LLSNKDINNNSIELNIATLHSAQKLYMIDYPLNCWFYCST